MKRFAHLVALVVLASTVTVALGAGGGGGGGGGAGGGGGGRRGRGGQGGFGGQGQGAAYGSFGVDLNFYNNEYTIIVQQITLSADEQPQVKTETDTMDSEVNTFMQNAQTQMAGNRGGRGRRGGATTDPATQQAMVAKLGDDLQLLVDDHQVKIDSTLTPDQRIAWETFKLHRLLDPRLQTLGLTDDQKDKVKSLVDDTVKSIVALTDGKDIQTLNGKLYRTLVSEILTETQAAKLLDSPTGMPPGGRGGQGGGFANNGGGAAGGQGGQGGQGGNGFGGGGRRGGRGGANGFGGGGAGGQGNGLP